MGTSYGGGATPSAQLHLISSYGVELSPLPHLHIISESSCTSIICQAILLKLSTYNNKDMDGMDIVERNDIDQNIDNNASDSYLEG